MPLTELKMTCENIAKNMKCAVVTLACWGKLCHPQPWASAPNPNKPISDRCIM